MRGDDPLNIKLGVDPTSVLPACAGMIPGVVGTFDVGYGAPRMRGDDPGSTYQQTIAPIVLPACAGMIP